METKNMTILEAMQQPLIESYIVRACFALEPDMQKRLKKGYMLKSGIWSADRLRAEYLKIMTLSSSEPSTVRRIISVVAYNAFMRMKVEQARKSNAEKAGRATKA